MRNVKHPCNVSYFNYGILSVRNRDPLKYTKYVHVILYDIKEFVF